MIDTIYLEREVATHPRSRELLARFARARVIGCERYAEVFNRARQDFRVQKRRPALILAARHGRRVLPAPPGYAVAPGRSFYFSHMLNCLYDCRYCFLQGMFRAAHYVLFVNFEDFVADIRAAAAARPDEPAWFFSGYDCDSLALEPVTGFARHFVPALDAIDNAWLELRTKSTQVRALLERDPAPRTVCAFSLNPPSVAAAHEHRAPAVAQRLDAMQRLGRHGWPLALRFDPLLLVTDFRQTYGEFFRDVLARLEGLPLHSITLGAFRLPRAYFRRTRALYPDEPLLAQDYADEDGVVGYRREDERAMLAWARAELESLAPGAPVLLQH
ncbi:MAG: spore photoproduct lyase family protein [Gammaproteobacteria bacterium]